MKKHRIVALLLTCLIASSAVSLAADNQLTDQEKKDGWILLFNGQDYTGWKCNNGKEVASPVEENAIESHSGNPGEVFYFRVVATNPAGDAAP